MIEIFAIYKFCQLLGRKLRAKNRNPIGYQILLVVLWFLSEFMAAFITAILISPTDNLAPAYLAGFAGQSSAPA